MEQVRLLPVSPQIKERIDKHGEIWNVLECRFRPAYDKHYPMLCVVSLDGEHQRWVERHEYEPIEPQRATLDERFDVV